MAKNESENNSTEFYKALNSYRSLVNAGGGDPQSVSRVEGLLKPIVSPMVDKVAKEQQKEQEEQQKEQEEQQKASPLMIQNEVLRRVMNPPRRLFMNNPKVFRAWLERVVEQVCFDFKIGSGQQKLYVSWRAWRDSKRTKRPFQVQVELLRQSIKPWIWHNTDADAVFGVMAERLNHYASSIKASTPDGFYAWLKATTFSVCSSFYYSGQKVPILTHLRWNTTVQALRAFRANPTTARNTFGVAETWLRQPPSLRGPMPQELADFTETLIQCTSWDSYVNAVELREVVMHSLAQMSWEGFEQFHEDRLRDLNRRHN